VSYLQLINTGQAIKAGILQLSSFHHRVTSTGEVGVPLYPDQHRIWQATFTTRFLWCLSRKMLWQCLKLSATTSFFPIRCVIGGGEFHSYLSSHSIKVNVQLSLCFFLNWAPRHEGVMGSGGIAPCILELGIRWRWVGGFNPLPLYHQVRNPWYPLDRRLVGPQSRSGYGGEE